MNFLLATQQMILPESYNHRDSYKLTDVKIWIGKYEYEN